MKKCKICGFILPDEPRNRLYCDACRESIAKARRGHKIKYCAICGEKLSDTAYRSAKYCEKCKLEAERQHTERQLERKRRARAQKEYERSSPPKPSKSISEIALEARVAGMNYGEYVAKLPKHTVLEKRRVRI